MRLIIFHYHLNPGGVTRIIESQIESLRQNKAFSDIIVLTGDCSDTSKITSLGAKIEIHPLLNYLSNNFDEFDYQLNQIQKIFRTVIADNDIIHAHNLNLGKNPLVTMVLSEMAKKGFRLVNHAHDFAEDRPVNNSFLEQIICHKYGYKLHDILYPDLPNYLFVTLNSLDCTRLEKYGVVSDRIYLMPNPVVFNTHHSEVSKLSLKKKICKELQIDDQKKLLVYPVRVIRRKNIGEFILLSVLFREISTWVVTQSPLNPVEIEPYLKWKEFCEAYDIGIIWEAGKKVNFEELIKAADFCVTTSIQEGFGMVYLEPWLMGTPVIGRDIEMVTNDIISSGIDFPVLYKKLVVPFKGSISELHNLNIEDQLGIIERSINSSDFISQIFANNPFLLNFLKDIKSTTVEKNKAVILEDYSLEKYGDRLNGIYQKIT